MWIFCSYIFIKTARKKKPEGENKTYMLHVRMTEAYRLLIEEAAKGKNLQTSTWARLELDAIARKYLGPKRLNNY